MRVFKFHKILIEITIHFQPPVPLGWEVQMSLE